MKKFFLNNWHFILIIILSGFIIWPVFVSGYFSHHDDLQIMRIFEMRKCFTDFQIPCRWVPDMGYGNGYPLFNFYGVLPYYVGAIASYLLGFIGAAKLLFLLPLVFGGIGMYLLAKELFGKTPGLVGAALYLLAPYRALDAYVRGAIGESFALALIPFVFYFFLKLIKSQEKKYFLPATLATGLFLISHNITVLIFTPLIIMWVLLLLYKEHWKDFKLPFLSLALAFGLSAFFILPAFLEKSLVQVDSLTTGQLDFRNQFVKVSQLFIDRYWNYSGSNPQSLNTISYQIGWPHWWLVIMSLFALVFSKKRKNVLLFIFLLSIFMFGIFMTHNKSAPVWEFIKILAFVQFPWRFLSIVIFSASLMGAYFVSFLEGKRMLVVALFIVCLTVLLNWQYFKPEHFYYGLTDNDKLSGQNFVDQQKGALLDYLPKTALEPRELAPQNPYVISGKATLTNFVNKSNNWKFDAEVKTGAVVEVPVFNFAGWVVNYPQKTGTIGRIAVSLPVGKHEVVGKFENTPIRTVGNILTILSFVTLVLVYAKNRRISG
jgi:hypothetical protein